MAKTLYLLRHGSTEANGRFIGSTDLPVSELGFHQLEATRKLLEAEDITRVFRSPMLRCRQTAEHLQLQDRAIECEPLREIDFGAWEGKTFDEIARGWPDTVRQWGTWSESFTFPAGENIGGFIQRIKEIKTRIDLCDDQKILVISHGGVIRNFICMYLGLSADKYLLFDIKAGCYATLSLFSEGGVLTSLNRG
jgi:broad specificity phosphatase PhoE